MAEPKTKATSKSVTSFLNKVTDKERREDCFAVVEMMKEVTKEKPTMWGSSIVGFGRYKYKYESGRVGEWPVAAFSPRKGDLTLYLVPSLLSAPDLMKQLGKHKTAKSCLYIKSLADVDRKVLKKLIEKSVKKMADKRIKA